MHVKMVFGWQSARPTAEIASAESVRARMAGDGPLESMWTKSAIALGMGEKPATFA